MHKRLGILFAILSITLFGGLVWQVLRTRDKLFHGKPEREWIKSITYYGDDAQLKQWREFGPAGLRLLAGTLDHGRLYRKTYRWVMPRLPGVLSGSLYSRLPNPADSHATRMRVISLLRQFGKDAKPVEPAIARALNDDDQGVRLSALGCYEELLEVMGEKEKLARLPEFLRAMQDSDAGIRNNAAVALWHYPGQAQVFAPVLVKALQDPDVGVRMLAAKALAHVDPQAGLRAGIVPVVVEILRDPDDQVAYQAAELLGELKTEPALAVPALAESVQGTNALVASTAARALARFGEQARPSIPALRKALEHPHSGVRREALNALKQIDPAAATASGVK
jgi:HEAT repeat protein